jgi:hypothetical protein
METIEVYEDDEDEEYGYMHATNVENSSGVDQSFREDLYVGKLKDKRIGRTRLLETLDINLTAIC